MAAYWNDPHHQKQFSDPKLDVLLARLNNQTGHNASYGKFAKLFIPRFIPFDLLLWSSVIYVAGVARF